MKEISLPFVWTLMLRSEANKTLNALNLHLSYEMSFDVATGMPIINACNVIPTRIVPFNKARRKENCECGVHFYIEDYAFSNLWRQPMRYVSMLSRFDCVISPDFSTYFDMPSPMVRWQIYRRRFLTQWLQRMGINVVYNIQTLQGQYDNDQFSGVERGGVVAMRPPLNINRNNRGRNEFYRILNVITEKLSPKMVLMYGKEIPLPTSMNYKFYENDNIRIRRTLAERKRGILA